MAINSSTFLAVVSILTILAVLGVAINDSENNSRNPFPSNSVKAENQFGALSSNNIANKPFNNQSTTASDSNPKTGPEVADNNLSGSVSAINSNITNTASPLLNTGTVLVKNINNETLRNAGFQNFYIKTKPFNNLLFEHFDLSILEPLQVTQKVITQMKGGNVEDLMNTYEFNPEDKQAADEIFEFIKGKANAELGVKVNQTNQFGLASFFINWDTDQTKAFLVVKTSENVYALSYPKTILNDRGELTDLKTLISKLIQELM